MFRIAVLIAVFLLSSCHSKDSLSSIKNSLYQNQCLNENLISPLHSIWSELQSIAFSNSSETQTNRIELANQLIKQLALVKEIKFMCNLDQIAESLHDDWLESAGYLFLTASNCFKDVGAEFLILDSVIKSFENKNYTDGLFNTVALGILGYQMVQDCKPLFSFFGFEKSKENLIINLAMSSKAISIPSSWGSVAFSTRARVVAGMWTPGTSLAMKRACQALLSGATVGIR